MTYEQACRKARKNLAEGKSRVSVVAETMHGDPGYDVADAEDLDTFYLGAKVVWDARDGDKP